MKELQLKGLETRSFHLSFVNVVSKSQIPQKHLNMLACFKWLTNHITLLYDSIKLRFSAILMYKLWIHDSSVSWVVFHFFRVMFLLFCFSCLTEELSVHEGKPSIRAQWEGVQVYPGVSNCHHWQFHPILDWGFRLPSGRLWLHNAGLQVCPGGAAPSIAVGTSLFTEQSVDLERRDGVLVHHVESQAAG